MSSRITAITSFITSPDAPHECRNLIDDPAASDVLASLRDGLRDWCERTGDIWPDVVIPPEKPQ